MAQLQVQPQIRPRHSLVFFSGGLDSTAVLWQVLTETNDQVTVFYYRFQGNFARRSQEAIDQLLPLIQTKTRPFEILTEQVMSPNVSMTLTRPQAAKLYLASLKRSPFPQPYDRILTGRCQADFQDGSFPRRCREADRLFLETWRRLAPPTDQTEPNPIMLFAYPLLTWEKEQIIEYLPTELFQLCWSCFRPTKNKKEGSIRLCGRCPSCKSVRQALQKKPKIEEKFKGSPWETLLKFQKSQLPRNHRLGLNRSRRNS